MGNRRRLVPWLLLGLLGLASALGLGLGLATSPANTQSAASTSRNYYVSLGDSYAVGYQPGPGPTLHGYANYVVKDARVLGDHFTLENFGCAGATTASILNAPGCAVPAIGGAPYGGSTQAAAAERFIADHRGQIGLITVSISGNDVTACATAASPLACIGTAVVDIESNVARLASGLRSAAGPRVPIIGLTYPDVILGKWVYPPVDQSLAELSVAAFKNLLNPALQRTYASARASLVDVTAATGAYVPLTRTVATSTYGTIPYSVAQVCRLTYFCAQGNIHADDSGYALIGRLIVNRLAAATSATAAARR